jgi:hypothetical protein
MRTTVVIDDDLLIAARSLAAARSVSAGRAISDLVRIGLKHEGCRKMRTKNGLPVFAVVRSAVPLTPEKVKQAEDEARILTNYV